MSATLHELAVEHGTDKARHGYCPFYDEMFGPYRDVIKKVLEIGVKDGASHRMWLDYFPNAHVYGLDNGSEGDATLWPLGRRFTVCKGDQGKLPDLWRIADLTGGSLDLVIDDGGHTMWQQQLSFAALWPLLRPGGWYVIEDLHTSRMDGYGRKNAPETTDMMIGRLGLELDIEILSYEGTERDATAIIIKSTGRRN